MGLRSFDPGRSPLRQAPWSQIYLLSLKYIKQKRLVKGINLHRKVLILCFLIEYYWSKGGNRPLDLLMRLTPNEQFHMGGCSLSLL